MMTNLPLSLAQGIAVIQGVVKTLPANPGVYRMLNDQTQVLYVGKAKDLKKRVLSYTQTAKLPNRLRRMVSETVSMEIVTTHSEAEALLLESNLIKKFQPHYNILLRDDKAFPYILLTRDHPYPRLAKHRGQQSIKGEYYGPFASVPAVEETLLTLHKVFLLRSCSDNFFAARTRPCLQYHIKRCSAPCVDKILPEDYAHLVKQAQTFLMGKTDHIQQDLAHKMQQASDALNYEEAAQYRDRIRLLNQIQQRQRVHVSGIQNADIIALYTHGGQTCLQIFFFRQRRNYGSESFFLMHTTESSPEESMSAFLTQFYEERDPPPLLLLSHGPNEPTLIADALQLRHHHTVTIEVPKRGSKQELVEHALSNAREALARKLSHQATFEALLQEVATIFNLPSRPDRIEVYDNSHLQGTHPYGVMVVAGPNGFEKKAYRKFFIKELKQKGDDYAMMRNVLKRRFARAGEKDWVLPNLILIDGGQGHLSVANEVIAELDVDGVTVAAIAKGPDRNAGRERFFLANHEPFSLPENSPILHFLQRLRDEAHRFAIGSHRSKRQKGMSKSILDDIPGIGAKRKKALLHHFGSAQSVRSATLQDLQFVNGINKSVAKKIYEYFHSR